jgi:hypothetical protein
MLHNFRSLGPTGRFIMAILFSLLVIAGIILAITMF